MQKTSEVVGMVFAYLRLLQKTLTESPNGLLVHWREYQAQATLHYRWAQRSDAAATVTTLAARLISLKPEDAQYVLYSPAARYYNPELLSSALAQLLAQPTSPVVTVHVADSSFTPEQLPLIEPIYGTRYAQRAYSSSEIAMWSSADVGDALYDAGALYLMAPNPFLDVPTNSRIPIADAQLLPIDETLTATPQWLSSQLAAVDPTVTAAASRDTGPAWYVWLRQDGVFRQPKVRVSVDLTFRRTLALLASQQLSEEQVSAALLQTRAMLSVYISVVVQAFAASRTGSAYDAALAGYSASFTATSRGTLRPRASWIQ